METDNEVLVLVRIFEDGDKEILLEVPNTWAGARQVVTHFLYGKPRVYPCTVDYSTGEVRWHKNGIGLTYGRAIERDKARLGKA